MQNKTKQLTLTGLFIALGLILPFFTAQIPTIGRALLPMHIPVLLAGFICGPSLGLAAGAVTPLLRSVLFGTPPLFPMAVAMTLNWPHTAFYQDIYTANCGMAVLSPRLSL